MSVPPHVNQNYNIGLLFSDSEASVCEIAQLRVAL